MVQKIGGAYNKANNWMNEKGAAIGKRIDDFKKGHPKFINGAKTLGNGVGKSAKFVSKHGRKAASFAKKTIKRNMPLALGMMGAAMSYATGSSGVVEAIGVGSGFNKGAEQFFASTTGTIAQEKAELAERSAEAAYEEQEFSMDSADDAIRNKEAEMSGNKNDRGKSGADIQALALDEAQQEAWKAKLAEEPLPEPPVLGEDASDEEKEKAEEMRAAKERQDDEKELAQLYLNRAQLGERSESKDAFMKAYLSQENVAGISRTASHKKEDIEARKNQLLQKILEAKAARNRQNGEVDGDSTNMLSDKDVSSADRAMKSITDSIDRSIIGAGGTMDLSRIIQRNLGLEDDGSAEYQAIMGAALDYRRTSIAAAGDSVDSKAAGLGIEEDALNEQAYRRTYNARS